MVFCVVDYTRNILGLYFLGQVNNPDSKMNFFIWYRKDNDWIVPEGGINKKIQELVSKYP